MVRSRRFWLHALAGPCLCVATACTETRGAAEATAGAGGTASLGAGAAGAPAGAPPECGAVTASGGWAGWVMPNPVGSGLPNPASYQVSDSGNRVVDEVTGLTWQRHVDARTFTWMDAKQYCACLVVDGVAGWQLPSRIELASLVDWSKTSPSIDAEAFPDTTNENFWTAAPVTINPGLAYLVFFLNGHTTYSDETYEYRVRCVQPSPAPPSERYGISNGTVYDSQTKLTWQQQFPPERYGWDAAQSYCSGLELDGGGWRVPSINEVQTLVDDTVNPSIDLTAFPATPSEYFWSSSAVIDDASRAWTAFFTNGSTYSFAKTALKNVRCTRSAQSGMQMP